MECLLKWFISRNFRFSIYKLQTRFKSLKEKLHYSFFHLILERQRQSLFIIKSYRELCHLKFTYADRRLVWCLSAASEESEMRATCLSLANRNLIVAAKASRERESKVREEGNARGRGERRYEKLRRTIKRKRKRTTVACRRKREEMTERKSGRLWEDQSARGEEAAGPRTACVPEKVQCPPSEAWYWSRWRAGIKKPLDAISRLVFKNSTCKKREKGEGREREKRIYYIALRY